MAPKVDLNVFYPPILANTWQICYSYNNEVTSTTGVSVGENLILSCQHGIHIGLIAVRARRNDSITFNHVLEIVHQRPEWDLAMMRRKNPTHPCPFAKISDTDKLNKHELLTVIGYLNGDVAAMNDVYVRFPCKAVDPSVFISINNYELIAASGDARKTIERGYMVFGDFLGLEGNRHPNLPIIPYWMGKKSEPGSSGSPVYLGNEIVGIDIQGDEDGAGIAVHVSVIRVFLKEALDLIDDGGGGPSG